MRSLEKNKLLLFPFLMGTMLMVYSWYLSYPLSIDSLDDFVFNHVSPLYWFSLALLLASMYVMGVNAKSGLLKWAITVGIVMTMYSLSYFYYMLPGSDSHYFRGLTEYFIEKTYPVPSKPYHTYFEWPSFFLLNSMATSLSGLRLAYFEFMLYAIIGFLFVTALYVYVAKAHRDSGFLAVVSYFIMMFYFLNYQWAPFSLGFGLLLLLLMLETRIAESQGKTLMTLILFTGVSFTHTFLPLFFVLYQLVRYLLSRSERCLRTILLTITIYFATQLLQAPLSFAVNIKIMMYASPEWAQIVEATLAPAWVPLDKVAQTFSRFVVIVTTIVCGAGFVVLLIKRKLRLLDKAILLSGAIYSALGTLVPILGSRAIPLVFIPVSLGASHLSESRFGSYLKSFFLVLLILFLFVPLHTSFYDSQIMFQTNEAYQAENFMIDRYDWRESSLILAHLRVVTYLQAKQPYVAQFEDDVFTLLPRIEECDSIVYTVGLGKNLLRDDYAKGRMLREQLNVVYNNGSSYIATKSSDFTWAPAD